VKPAPTDLPQPKRRQDARSTQPLYVGWVSGSELDDWSPEQRALAEQLEPLWRRAYAIVARHPELDVSDVFHTLVNLKRSPSERLRRGLFHGRAGAQHR
jgi:hypothetical protein